MWCHLRYHFVWFVLLSQRWTILTSRNVSFPVSQVSKWTRLCELGIPSAVEEHLRDPQHLQLPASILALERRLAEPVRVHNDDKIRRQKLKEKRQNWKKESAEGGGNPDSESERGQSPQVSNGLELRTALAKLSVNSVPSSATRGSSEIRKVKTTDLPPLERVFAEGLYFTLTDMVLLPCIYQYLVRALEFMSNVQLLSVMNPCRRWVWSCYCDWSHGLILAHECTPIAHFFIIETLIYYPWASFFFNAVAPC